MTSQPISVMTFWQKTGSQILIACFADFAYSETRHEHLKQRYCQKNVGRQLESLPDWLRTMSEYIDIPELQISENERGQSKFLAYGLIPCKGRVNKKL